MLLLFTYGPLVVFLACVLTRVLIVKPRSYGGLPQPITSLSLAEYAEARETLRPPESYLKDADLEWLDVQRQLAELPAEEALEKYRRAYQYGGVFWRCPNPRCIATPTSHRLSGCYTRPALDNMQ